MLFPKPDFTREKPIKIAHLVHPIVAHPGSDLVVAQPITLATMNRARDFVLEYAQGGIDVRLYAAQYHDEERILLPESFIRTPDLIRSVGDIRTFNKWRKLALIKDLLDLLNSADDADFLIYTNVDICLQPYFYLVVAAEIMQGYDSFIITRRSISNRYKTVDEISLMVAELGAGHPGWDCFIFARGLYPRFRLGQACIGTDWIGRMMIANMASLGKKFKVFTDLHATFHIGDERAWKSDEFSDYGEHNKSECRKTLLEFDKLLGPFDRKGLPGRFLKKY